MKNIEYSKRDCLLVTSGFDGSIFTWDLNSYTENNLTYQKVFHTPGKLGCLSFSDVLFEFPLSFNRTDEVPFIAGC